MSDWKIVNGNLPFKDEFAERATGFDGYPSNLWIIHNDGYLPTKSSFATRAMIDDAPEALWRIKNDGRLPFKKNFTFVFPAIIDDAPLALWRMVDGELPHKVVFPQIYELDWYPPTTSWLQYAGYIPYRPWPGKIQIPNIVEPIEIPDVDWTKSMQQTFEYYTVNPETWYDDKQVTTVTSSNHSHDTTSELKGSATLSTTEQLGETYIRTYMVCKQGRYTHRECLGTYLYMTSSDNFDGIKHNYTMTGYTPLVELQEALPPVGYFVYGQTKKGDEAPFVTEEIRKAIVNNTRCEFTMNVTIPKPLLNNFIAGTSDNWLTVVNNMLSASSEAKYTLMVDEWGTVMLRNKQSADAMQPKFVFDDGNASILLPDIDTSEDLFAIPNTVELIFAGNRMYNAHKVTVRNDDETSPVSVQKRGREIKRRYTITNIAVPTGTVTEEIVQNAIEEQAYSLLEALSTVTKTISFSHGYCGSKVGDCVMINYERAGLINVKAVITSQKVNCTPGCQVDETAVYTKKYWRRS